MQLLMQRSPLTHSSMGFSHSGLIVLAGCRKTRQIALVRAPVISANRASLSGGD